MRTSIICLSFAMLIALPADARPKGKQLSFRQRAAVRMAPVRVYHNQKALSKVDLGLSNKRRIVKSVQRQLPDGRQVFKTYGHKTVGNKRYRSVLSTVVKPDGSATHTLHVKGLLKRSWTGKADYKKMTKRGAVTSAVMASPVTKGGLTLTLFGASMLTFPGVTPVMAAKGMLLPTLFSSALVAGASQSQMAPNVQTLNQ